MAERRMFAKAIVLSDAFLDLPMSARCLYFTLSMFADDDGFVGSPKAVMRQCGASQDDIAVLLQKRFLLGFDSGVVVIKHWRINNYLRNDRYKPSVYDGEKKLLYIDTNNGYTDHPKEGAKPMIEVTNDPENEEIPPENEAVYQRYTNGIPSIGKNREEKNSIEKSSVARAREKIFQSASFGRGKYNNIYLTDDEFKRFAIDHIDYREKIDRLSVYLHNHPNVNYTNHYDKLCEWANQDG